MRLPSCSSTATPSIHRSCHQPTEPLSYLIMFLSVHSSLAGPATHDAGRRMLAVESAAAPKPLPPTQASSYLTTANNRRLHQEHECPAGETWIHCNSQSLCRGIGRNSPSTRECFVLNDVNLARCSCCCCCCCCCECRMNHTPMEVAPATCMLKVLPGMPHAMQQLRCCLQ
jgi:hypothetical protein